MLHTALSFNGGWEMDYSENAYTGEQNPWKEGVWVENAVPGYWEDMTEQFTLAAFFKKLKVNPEYGLQRYPMVGPAPDMALPNVLGTFFYRRSFWLEKVDAPAEIWLGGVQNAVAVWLNDVYLGRHEGYSTPVALAIPEGVLQAGENTIVLSVSNLPIYGYEGQLITGLTNRAANEGTGGITGDVELRVYTSPLRDAVIKVAEDCSRVDVQVVTAEPAQCSWAVYDGDILLGNGSCSDGFSFDTKDMTLWTPEEPKLYTLEITCGEGVLKRKFGVRRLTVDGTKVLLNGKPCFLRGICEHGYFPETVHPTSDPLFYRNLIRKVKELGFNFIRQHTFVPDEAYMQAADELGILVEVESPNNTTLEQWHEIVTFCRRHTSVVMYSTGNEMLIDEPYIDHLEKCADAVHGMTDALFSPMSALRGVEYYWDPTNLGEDVCNEPFPHNPVRMAKLSKFCDLYNSYSLGMTSYDSMLADTDKLEAWGSIYNKPRLSHEIGIQGTYTDLSLEERYKDTRVGDTKMFSSLRKHLEARGMIKKAPLYFRNSCQWQRRLRKHCFETTRHCESMAGYDFLGPIDTHWHTFGYDVGMMNEFYELKPGETVRNVLSYNGATVLLTEFGTDRNYAAGQTLRTGVFVSHYGSETLKGAFLNIRLTLEGKLIASQRMTVEEVELGKVSKLCDFSTQLPQVEKPGAMQLYITLEGGDTYAENSWELYVFPQIQAEAGDLLIADAMTEEELVEALQAGKNVLLFGTKPFRSLDTTFQQALAGRTSGNLATVVADHPVMADMPHEGFCGWQFRFLMEQGAAVCFESDIVPFDPIVEMVTSHKFAIRQAALFEFRVFAGKLLVCGFHFDEEDPASCWLKAHLIRYASGDAFQPKHTLNALQLDALLHTAVVKTAGNDNNAFNPNDKAAVRKAK